jgi:hypothetical protein
MSDVFLAYASGNDFQETIIKDSAREASSDRRTITPWSEKDTSGQQIQKSVETWINNADAFIGDISIVNMNVTYEVGYKRQYLSTLLKTSDTKLVIHPTLCAAVE